MRDRVEEQQRPAGERDALRVFAHEVANRLDGALRSVSMVRRAQSSGETPERLRRAEESLVALSALTRAALSDDEPTLIYSRSENRRLCEAIDLAVGSVVPWCEPRGIAIETSRADLPTDLLSRGLESVLLNALWNAIEAIGRDGRIRIGVRTDGEHLALTVTDDGPGVPGDILDCAFDPVAPDALRTGIGLAHARSIVESLGGTIELLNNENGGGATLRARVPVESLRGNA